MQLAAGEKNIFKCSCKQETCFYVAEDPNDCRFGLCFPTSNQSRRLKLTQNFLHQDKLTSGEGQTALNKRTIATQLLCSCRRGIAVTTLTLNTIA